MEPRRILIADDDEAVRERIASALTPAGYEVEAAGDGRGALDRLRAEVFDLLILDVMMPWMDGIQVMQTLQKEPVQRPLPIIMLVPVRASVEEMKRVSEWFCSLGAVDVIVKHRLQDGAIIERVRKALSSGAQPGDTR